MLACLECAYKHIGHAEILLKEAIERKAPIPTSYLKKIEKLSQKILERMRGGYSMSYSEGNPEGNPIGVKYIPFCEEIAEICKGLSLEECKKKIRELYYENPYKYGCIEEKEPKENFDERSFRTLIIPAHEGKERTYVVIGCPKGEWDEEKKICKVGTRTQKIIRSPLDEKCINIFLACARKGEK